MAKFYKKKIYTAVRNIYFFASLGLRSDDLQNRSAKKYMNRTALRLISYYPAFYLIVKDNLCNTARVVNLPQQKKLRTKYAGVLLHA